MSGFEAWAATFNATLAIGAGMLVVGVALGWLWATRPRHVTRRERRELADRAERRVLRAQLRWLGQLRETRGGTVMPHEVHHQDPDVAREAWLAHMEQVAEALVSHSTYAHAAFSGAIDPPPYRSGTEDEEWASVHVGQALAIANGDPITTGEIRAMTAAFEEDMARLLGEHPVPYPDGSGQGAFDFSQDGPVVVYPEDQVTTTHPL